MESLLVDEFGEADYPCLDDIGMAGVELEFIVAVTKQPDAHLLAEDVLGLQVENFKLSVEVKVNCCERLNVGVEGVRDEQGFVDECEEDVTVVAARLRGESVLEGYLLLVET